VPLYWIALLWTAKRNLVADPWNWDVVGDLFFVPHFHRLYTESIFPALVPGWTINYEMFFYAIFALSLLRGAHRYRFVTIVLLGLVALGATRWQSAPGIFYTSSVLLEFLLGIGVWFACTRFPLRLSRAAAVALTVLAGCGLAIENSDAIRGFADGPFAALFVWSALQWCNGWRAAWLHRLGDASYSIYLFHLASFWIPDHLLRLAGISSPTPLNVAVVLAAHLLTAMGVGLAIHRWLERPLLDFLRERLARSRYGAGPRLAMP
jgi:exopolysaccharide production protein ExoZ